MQFTIEEDESHTVSCVVFKSKQEALDAQWLFPSDTIVPLIRSKVETGEYGIKIPLVDAAC